MRFLFVVHKNEEKAEQNSVVFHRLTLKERGLRPNGYFPLMRQPLFLFCRNPAASLLSESMVSFDPLCGIAARKETMKHAGLRLHVIWTLPVFYYLDLRMIEINNCARSVKRMRAFFYYVGNIAQRYFRNNDKSILRSGAHG